MLEFRKITIKDREAIHRKLYQTQGHGSEYSFANLFCWGDQRVCFWEDDPLILSRFGSHTSYLFPAWGKWEEAVDLLRRDARERGIQCRLFGLTGEEAERMEARFPGTFSYHSLRDSFDYIYDIDRLMELKGKKLQAKRNHCNRFVADFPDYEILPLTEEVLPLCKKMLEEWYAYHEEANPEIDYEGEKQAISAVFANYSALGFEGIALRTEAGIVAFSMGNRIREDTFDVNFEKAIGEINGAYPMINREFARKIHSLHPQIRFLNREDDMGLEGLRRAKESYFPDILLEKFVAEEG